MMKKNVTYALKMPLILPRQTAITLKAVRMFAGFMPMVNVNPAGTLFARLMLMLAIGDRSFNGSFTSSG